jgi:hypothetical protein
MYYIIFAIRLEKLTAQRTPLYDNYNHDSVSKSGLKELDKSSFFFVRKTSRNRVGLSLRRYPIAPIKTALAQGHNGAFNFANQKGMNEMECPLEIRSHCSGVTAFA